MKAISSSITKIVALIAAMVVALGTFGLTTAHAASYDTSTITNPEPSGTITINPVDTRQRQFSGYQLAELENVKTDSTGTALGSFTVKTNTRYTTVIENVMGQITDPSTGKTLLASYQDDASYYNKTDVTHNNPMGYIAATYGSVAETEKPWGADNADGSKDTVMRQFADKLAEKLVNLPDSDPLTHGKATLTTGDNGKMPQGLYLITEDTTLHGADGKDIKSDRAVTGAAVNSAPMIVSTTYTLKDKDGNEATITKNVGTINLKATSPTITKEVRNGNGNDEASKKANPDFSIGDEVDYQLTATIPSYTGYDIDTTGKDSGKARVLKIYDKAEPGLTITADSVKSVTVTPDGSSEAIQLHKDADYTVTSGSYTNPDNAKDSYNDGTLTTIDLANYVNMREGTTSRNSGTVLSGGKITVEINATLNSKANVSDAKTQTPNKNETILGYSHIPNDVTDEHKQPGGEVYVYTYKFQITKKNRKGEKLKGAQFAIKNADDDYLAWDGTNAKWTNLGKKKPTAAAQASAAPDDESTDNKAGIFYSGADGTVSFDGLKAGTYTIEEIASPSGYLNALLPSFKVTIKPTYSQDTSTKPTDATSWGDYENNGLTISNKPDGNNLVTASDNNGGNVDVTNVTSITQLPKTGAAGIAFFSVIGVAIVALAALFAVRARKAAKMA